jgi:hypothetical protein
MDNRYFNYGCPSLMQDGSFLTNFTPKRTHEQMIRKLNNINSSADYRLFLQQNGETIRQRENEWLIKNNTCDVNGQCVKML